MDQIVYTNRDHIFMLLLAEVCGHAQCHSRKDYPISAAAYSQIDLVPHGWVGGGRRLHPGFYLGVARMSTGTA